METWVKYETADRYRNIQLYITECIAAMFNIYIEEVDIVGLHLQHTLPEQNTLSNENIEHISRNNRI